MIPKAVRTRARRGLWLDVSYFGDRHAQFRVQYVSEDRTAPLDGLYQPAEQRWNDSFAKSQDALEKLAQKALAEHRAATQ